MKALTLVEEPNQTLRIVVFMYTCCFCLRDLQMYFLQIMPEQGR